MLQVVQENNMLKMKYYELMAVYNKEKNENERTIHKNKGEIEHLNKINAFMKHKNMELNKIIVDKNKQMLSILNKQSSYTSSL
jgi:hypothetical protein